MDDIPSLSPDRITYLQRLVDALEAPEPFTEVELLLENVFQELGSCYLSALCTRDSSMLLERLLSFADGSWASRFTLDLVGHSWPDLLQNPYASRVFDAALKALTRSDVAPEKVVEFVQLFLRSNKQMAAMVASQYASQSLKHLIVMMNSFPSIRKTKIHLRHMLIQHIDLIETAMTTHGSSFLQFLILDSYHFDEHNHEVQKPASVDEDMWTVKHSEDWEKHGGSSEYQLILNAMVVDESKFGTLARNQAASRLVEVVLKVSPVAAYSSLYETRMKSKLVNFVKHPVANFVVQRLIEFARTSAQFTEMYEELRGHLSEFFAGRSGVIVQLVHGAIKETSAQTKVLEDLLAALSSKHGTPVDALRQGEFCKAILTLDNAAKNVFKKRKEKERNTARKEKDSAKPDFSALGCQLLAELFKFNAKLTDFIVNGFLSLDKDLLLSIALDRNASRTFEALLMAKQVPSAAKQLFATKFTDADVISTLALDKSGSHVLDQLFVMFDVEQKFQIAQHIIPLEKQLLATLHGKFVIRNCRLSELKHDPEKWKKEEAAKVGRQKAFEEIFAFQAGDAPQPKAKKPKQHKTDRPEKMDVDEQSHKAHKTHKEHKSPSSKPSSSHHHDKSKKDQDHRRESRDHYEKGSNKSHDKEHEHKSKHSKPVTAPSAPSAGKSADKAKEEKPQKEKTSKKRAREEPEDDIDEIFAVAESAPPTKKPKHSEQTSKPSEKSHKPSSVEPQKPATEGLSKMKLKKLAKAEKAAKRAAATVE